MPGSGFIEPTYSQVAGEGSEYRRSFRSAGGAGDEVATVAFLVRGPGILPDKL
jgi:hypothetical protein